MFETTQEVHSKEVVEASSQAMEERGKSGFHSKNREGLEICFSWNNKQGRSGEAQTRKPS